MENKPSIYEKSINLISRLPCFELTPKMESELEHLGVGYNTISFQTIYEQQRNFYNKVLKDLQLNGLDLKIGK